MKTTLVKGKVVSLNPLLVNILKGKINLFRTILCRFPLIDFIFVLKHVDQLKKGII